VEHKFDNADSNIIDNIEAEDIHMALNKTQGIANSSSLSIIKSVSYTLTCCSLDKLTKF